MPIAPGTRIGPYEVVGWLGAGGMGEVYRARDPRFARDVAIKLISETVATDRTRVHRFEQEARAVGQLNHPNILAVYDIGTHEGAPYIVSELLEGETLRDRLKRGALSSSKAVAAARQIAEGLAAAHDKGIVHRDLKPDNLFVTSDGRIKILDFGIAKLTRPGDDTARETGFPTDTTPGMVIGTVGYMSPEQVRGAAVDHRSDLFSFGTILYEVLTGRQAFTRQTGADSMSAILNEDPTESLGASASPGLARIVSRCLEKSREARFQSARDLAFALEVLSGTNASAQVAVLPRRRWGVTVGVALGVLVVVAVVVGWPTDTTPSIETRLANATFTALTNSDASELEAAISPKGDFITFLSDRDGPFHVFLRQVHVGEDRNLTPGMPDQRNAGLNMSVGFYGEGSEIWLGGSRGVRLRVLPILPGPSRAFLDVHAVNVAWSRDAKRLVYFTFDRGDPMFVADGDGGNEHPLYMDDKGDHNHFPAWSTDGKWIYYTHGIHAISDYDVYRIPSAGGEPERLTYHNADVRYVTPIDDRTVLYVAPDEDGSGPWLWALDTVLRTYHRVSVGLERYLSLSASADGLRLVATVATSTPTARVWSVPIHEGSLAEEREVTPYNMSAVRAWAPRLANGSLFYLSSSGGADGLWRYEDGKPPTEIRKGTAGPLREPAAVSPNANQVAVVVREGRKRHLAIVNTDGSGSRPLPEDIDVRGISTWTPDSKSIVTGGSDAKGAGLFKIPIDGGTPVRLWTGQAFDPAVSAKGDLVVFTGQQAAQVRLRAVRLSDLSEVTLQTLDLEGKPESIGVPFGGGGRARFLPDGRLVYLKGQIGRYDFWLLNLATNTSQQLTRLANPATIYAFDITPDGRRIVFDRIRENSDIRMIDLKKK